MILLRKALAVISGQPEDSRQLNGRPGYPHGRGVRFFGTRTLMVDTVDTLKTRTVEIDNALQEASPREPQGTINRTPDDIRREDIPVHRSPWRCHYVEWNTDRPCKGGLTLSVARSTSPSMGLTSPSTSREILSDRRS